ncbi:MAG TPA: hypothetical protein VGN57_07945 [Pirellulaceae bacterium]|jgi:FtsH-binding integral membrane protein|nr:hypothetical protein [Pirellulaceae bacterium]
MQQTDPDTVELIIVLAVFGGVMLFGLCIQAFVCWITAKTAAAIPQQFREVEPGLVWLLLIPCFPLVWNFFVFPKIASGYQRYFHAMGQYQHGDCGAGLALWFCLCAVFSVVPIVQYIASLAWFILVIILLVKFWDLKGQAERAAGGIVPTFATASAPLKKVDPTNPYA